MKRRDVLASLGITGIALAGGSLASASPANISFDKNSALSSVVEFSLLKPDQWKSGELYFVSGYYAENTHGAGFFLWDSERLRSAHNGGTVISPTVPWDGSIETHTDFLTGAGETAKDDKGCFVKVLLQSEISYDDFGAARDGKHDATEAVKAAHQDANARQLPVVQHSGRFLLNKTGPGISVKTDTDLRGATILCTIDYTTITPRLWTYLFLLDQEQEELTAIVDKSELTKGAARIPSLAGHSGMISIQSSTPAMMRWGRQATAMREPHTIGFKNGELNKPLYFDFSAAEDVRVYFKPWVQRIEFQCPKFEFNAQTNIRAFVKVARNNARVCNMEANLGEQEKSVPVYTPIAIRMCADVEVEGLYCDHSGKPAPEQINAYLILMTDSVGIHLHKVRNYTGWSGINGNYFSDLLLEDFVVYSIGGHAYVRDLTFRNGTFFQHCLLQGMGTLTLERVTHQNILQSKSDRFIFIRNDYGESWDGDVVIRDCKAVLGDTVDRYIILRSEPIGYDPQGSTFDPNLDINGFVVQSSKAQQEIYGYYGGKDVGSEATKVLPERISIRNLTIEGNAPVHFCAFWCNRQYNNHKLPISRNDILNIHLQNIYYLPDPALSPESEKAYALVALDIPQSSSLRQHIIIDNVTWGGIALQNAHHITARISHSVLWGGWRLLSAQEASSAPPTSRLTFQHCQIAAPDNGAGAKTLCIPTEYVGCTFSASLQNTTPSKPVSIGSGAHVNGVRFAACAIEKPRRAEDNVDAAFGQKVLLNYINPKMFYTG